MLHNSVPTSKANVSNPITVSTPFICNALFPNCDQCDYRAKTICTECNANYTFSNINAKNTALLKTFLALTTE